MHTVKFQHFSVTHFLREINYEDFVSSKTAIFAASEALNFVFGTSGILKIDFTLNLSGRKSESSKL